MYDWIMAATRKDYTGYYFAGENAILSVYKAWGVQLDTPFYGKLPGFAMPTWLYMMITVVTGVASMSDINAAVPCAAELALLGMGIVSYISLAKLFWYVTNYPRSANLPKAPENNY
jgi:hypothetical protein